MSREAELLAVIRELVEADEAHGAAIHVWAASDGAAIHVWAASDATAEAEREWRNANDRRDAAWDALWVTAKGDTPPRDPDHIYTVGDAGYLYPWETRNVLHDEARDVGILAVGTMYEGPRRYLAEVPTSYDENGDWDDTEVRWFDTLEEAKKARGGK